MTATLLGRSGDSFEASIRAQELPPGLLDDRWLPLPELERTLFDTDACASGDVDLVLVPADWLPRLAARGAIRALDPLLSASPPQGWPEAWSSAFTDVVSFARDADAAPSVWGLPFHDGPPLLVYRRDLFESPDERRAYRERFGEDLVPARTWRDFEQQALFFTRPDDDLFGTVFAGAPDGHNDVYDLVTQIRLRGGDVLDGRRPAFGGRAGVEALAFLRRHLVEHPTVPPEAIDLDSVHSGAAFAAGRVALMLNWAGYAHAAEGPGSRVAGRVGVALAPTADDGSATTVVNAFWALAVTSGARHVEEAWAVARECLSERGDLATTRAGSSGTRLGTWRDPGILRRSPAFALFERAHENSRPLPMVEELPVLVAVLDDLYDRVVRRGEEAEGALEEAVAQATEAMARDSADV